jgi:hypothetical protein
MHVLQQQRQSSEHVLLVLFLVEGRASSFSYSIFNNTFKAIYIYLVVHTARLVKVAILQVLLFEIVYQVNIQLMEMVRATFAQQAITVLTMIRLFN